MFLGLNLVWAISGFYFFRNNFRIPALNSYQYYKPVIIIFIGVAISMFLCDFFWGQSIKITLITQRWEYAFIWVFTLLYVQPTEKDYLKALKWITICVIIVWIIAQINPLMLTYWDEAKAERIQEAKEGIAEKERIYVLGIYFVLIYYYYLISEFLKKQTREKTVTLLILLAFFILYRNRSFLIGIIPITIYTLFKIKSKYKTGIIFSLTTIISVVILFTSDIWFNLFDQTQTELNDQDYNRWKAFWYYLFDYSPNTFCYILGNGYPSGGNSPIGKVMFENYELGIFQSDLGMLGMWTFFGILPLIAIYTILFKILKQKHYPTYLKYLSFHILIVPTIFEFYAHTGVIFFSLLIYIYSYHTVLNKLNKKLFIKNSQYE